MLSAAATNVLAIGVLAAMVLGCLFYCRRELRRLQFSPLQGLLFAVNRAVARLLWRARVNGTLRIPPGEGAVIVSNHRSPVDPSFLYLVTTRVVHWMVAREYCVHPAGAWFFRACLAIPVGRRGIDTTATKSAIRYVRQGGLVAIFPEGRINTTKRVLLPGRSGAALIALKARAPIVPCYVRGSPYDGTIWHSLVTPARVRLEIGRPIDVSEFYGREQDRQVLERVTKRVLREIARLAGEPDFEPEVAGRGSCRSATTLTRSASEESDGNRRK